MYDKSRAQRAWKLWETRKGDGCIEPRCRLEIFLTLFRYAWLRRRSSKCLSRFSLRFSIGDHLALHTIIVYIYTREDQLDVEKGLNLFVPCIVCFLDKMIMNIVWKKKRYSFDCYKKKCNSETRWNFGRVKFNFETWLVGETKERWRRVKVVEKDRA